jgi:hypothetical protein
MLANKPLERAAVSPDMPLACASDTPGRRVSTRLDTLPLSGAFNRQKSPKISDFSQF